MDYLRTISSWIADLVFPLRCLGCSAHGSALCSRCVGSIPLRTYQECIACKSPTPLGAPCARCAPHTWVSRLIAAGHTDHPLLSRAVHALKYEYVQAMAAPLADYLLASMARTIGSHPTNDPLFVPVPLHRQRLSERGFNQSALLTRHLCARIGMAWHDDILARTRHTGSQVKTTSRWERLNNMKGAFTVARPELVIDRDIILVDDVCTTGATLDACAQALSEAGARSVTAVVVARG